MDIVAYRRWIEFRCKIDAQLHARPNPYIIKLLVTLLFADVVSVILGGADSCADIFQRKAKSLHLGKGDFEVQVIFVFFSPEIGRLNLYTFMPVNT